MIQRFNELFEKDYMYLYLILFLYTLSINLSAMKDNFNPHPQNPRGILVKFLERNNITFSDLPQGKELFNYLNNLDYEKRNEVELKILNSLTDEQHTELSKEFRKAEIGGLSLPGEEDDDWVLGFTVKQPWQLADPEKVSLFRQFKEDNNTCAIL